jgi:hypothetical protein
MDHKLSLYEIGNHLAYISSENDFLDSVLICKYGAIYVNDPFNMYMIPNTTKTEFTRNKLLMIQLTKLAAGHKTIPKEELTSSEASTSEGIDKSTSTISRTTARIIPEEVSTSEASTSSEISTSEESINISTSTTTARDPKTMFLSNPTTNPRTGKKIRVDGPVYKKLVKEFGLPHSLKEFGKPNTAPATGTSLPNKVLIYNPTTKQCEEGDGIKSGYFCLNRDKWLDLRTNVEKYKVQLDQNKEYDYSSGGHGCIMTFNLYKLFKKLKVVDSVPKEGKMRDYITDMIFGEIESIEHAKRSGCRYVTDRVDWYQSSKTGKPIGITYCGKPVTVSKNYDKCAKHSRT